MEPKWAHFPDFWLPKSMQESKSFPEVEKVGSGTEKDAQVDPCTPRKHHFYTGFPRLKWKSFFSSERRPSALWDRRSAQNYPTSLPNGGQNALKTLPKTRLKNLCENYAKMNSKWSPKTWDCTPFFRSFSGRQNREFWFIDKDYL